MPVLAQTFFTMSAAIFLLAGTCVIWTRWLRGMVMVWAVATMPNRILASEVERRQQGERRFDYADINNMLAALSPPGYGEGEQVDADFGDDDNHDHDDEDHYYSALHQDTEEPQAPIPVAVAYVIVEDEAPGPPADLWHLLRAKRRA